MSEQEHLELHRIPGSSTPPGASRAADDGSLGSDDASQLLQGLQRTHAKAQMMDGEQLENSDEVRRFLTIFALGLCYVGSQISSYFTGPALDYIASDLKLSKNASWVPNSSSLALACTVPCAGYLQDLIGRRGSLAVGLLSVLVGTLLTALAKDFATLIAGGVFTGIGSGIEELTAIAAISELVPTRSRGLYLGLINAMNVPFTPAVLYASEISTHSTWRWLFWISFAWNGIASLATAVTFFRMKIDRPNSSGASAMSTLKQLDYIGIALFITGIIEILIAIQAGGETHPWKSAYVIAQLLVGLASIGLFIYWESLGHGQPLLPLRLFQGQRVVSLTYITCFFSGMPYSAALNLGTTINQYVWQFPPLKTGIISLGPSIGLALGAFLGNALISTSKGYAREVVVLSAIVMTAFTGAQAVISPTNSTLWAVIGSFSSIGIGATLVPLSTIVTLACPEDLIGTAVAFTITIRTLGGSVGYAIFYNIFSSELASSTPTDIAKAANLNNAGVIEKLITVFMANTASDYSEAAAAYGTSTVAAAQHAFQTSAGRAAAIVYYTAIPFALLALAPALFLPNMKRFLTKRVLTRSWSTATRTQS